MQYGYNAYINFLRRPSGGWLAPMWREVYQNGGAGVDNLAAFYIGQLSGLADGATGQPLAAKRMQIFLDRTYIKNNDSQDRYITIGGLNFRFRKDRTHFCQRQEASLILQKAGELGYVLNEVDATEFSVTGIHDPTSLT